jgi:predicted ATP-dependent endonuclease of OLD family
MKFTTGMSTNNISSFTIENFKAFNGAATIPLKPITLIFGPNSAGKSSILQSLRLLKQSVENSANKPYSQGGFSKGKLFEFGDIDELKYDNSPIKLSFPFDIKQLTNRKNNSLHPLNFYFRKYRNIEEIVNFIANDCKMLWLSISHDKKTNFDLFFDKNKIPVIHLSRGDLYGGTINSSIFNVTDFCNTFAKNNLEKLHKELSNAQNFMRSLKNNDEFTFSPDISTILTATNCEDIWDTCSFLFKHFEQEEHIQTGWGGTRDFSLQLRDLTMDSLSLKIHLV